MVSFADLLVRSPGVDAGEDKVCFRDSVIHQLFWPANCKTFSVNHDLNIVHEACIPRIVKTKLWNVSLLGDKSTPLARGSGVWGVGRGGWNSRIPIYPIFPVGYQCT